jgi:hypothetical protein
MYDKSIVKLLREGPGMSIYAIAKEFNASEGAISPCIKKLRAMHVVSDSNVLTDLGERLCDLIQATEQGWVRREKCDRLYGSDAIETGKELRIVAEKESVISIKEIIDPLPHEVLLAEMESSESRFAVSMVNSNKRFAGFFRPWQILLSPELSLEEKLELLGKWSEEYWPEVCAILSVGIPSAIVGGIILVNEANKSGDTLNAQQAPDPVGDVQHSPGAPLAPTYPLDTGGAGEFVGPNGEIIIRLG